MLRFLLLSAITLYPLSVNAQQINGLGDLKLGMTFSTFEQWVKQKGTTIKEERGNPFDNEVPSQSVMEITEPLPNIEEPLYSPVYTNYLQGYRSILINLYSVSGIEIRDLVLLFKNEALVYLKADMTEDLKEALTAKYGKPKEKIESKEITCTYTFTGAKFKKAEYRRTVTWRHDSVVAEGHEYAFYNSECELTSGSLISVERPDMDSFESFVGYDAYGRKNHAAELAYEKAQKSQKMDDRKKSLDKL